MDIGTGAVENRPGGTKGTSGVGTVSTRGSNVVVVDFRGAPPHDIGLAQLATAECADGHIEVKLYLLDDWYRPTDQIVRVEMTPSVARALAERLVATAAQAA